MYKELVKELRTYGLSNNSRLIFSSPTIGIKLSFMNTGTPASSAEETTSWIHSRFGWYSALPEPVLFGSWVPDSWIEEVFAACMSAPQNRYLFLTKNHQRYLDLAAAGKLPFNDNMWYGTTVTSLNDMFFFTAPPSQILPVRISLPLHVAYGWKDATFLEQGQIVLDMLYKNMAIRFG